MPRRWEVAVRGEGLALLAGWSKGLGVFEEKRAKRRPGSVSIDSNTEQWERRFGFRNGLARADIRG